MSNPHEELGRARKVARLMAKLPHGKTAAEVRVIADWVAAMDTDEDGRYVDRGERFAYAHAAGAVSSKNPKAPSEETWTLFVAAARARTPLEEMPDPFARSIQRSQVAAYVAASQADEYKARRDRRVGRKFGLSLATRGTR